MQSSRCFLYTLNLIILLFRSLLKIPVSYFEFVLEIGPINIYLHKAFNFNKKIILGNIIEREIIWLQLPLFFFICFSRNKIFQIPECNFFPELLYLLRSLRIQTIILITLDGRRLFL